MIHVLHNRRAVDALFLSQWSLACISLRTQYESGSATFLISGLCFISSTSDVLIGFAFAPSSDIIVTLVPFINSGAFHSSSLATFLYFPGLFNGSLKAINDANEKRITEVRFTNKFTPFFLFKDASLPKVVHPLAIWKSLTKNIENLSACVRASCPPLSTEFTECSIQLLSFSWAVRYERGLYVDGLRPSYCSAQFTSAAMSCLCWRMRPGFSKGKCLLSNHTSTQPHSSSSTINQTELWNITEHTATLWPLCITTTAPNSHICARAC